MRPPRATRSVHERPSNSRCGYRPNGSRAHAGGTADLARLFAQRVGDSGQVILTDINGAMLTVGRDRMLDEGRLLPAVQCNAEALPFPARSFDCVSIAFGLRNLAHPDKGLSEMRRVLRPGAWVGYFLACSK